MEDTRIRLLVLASASLAALLVGLLVTAPMGVIARIAEVQIERALAHQYDITIGRAGLRGPGTVLLRDIRIVRRAEMGAENTAPRPLPTEIDRLRLRIGLLSLVRQRPRADIRMQVDEGRLRASVAPAGSGHRFTATFDELELRRFQPLREAIGLPVQGRVNGTIALGYDADIRLDGGDLRLTIDNTILGPGDLHAEAFRPFGGFVPLPATRLGRITLTGTISGSDLAIDELTATGADVRFDVTGDAQLRDPLTATTIRLALVFSLNEDYVEDAGLAAALNLWPVLRQAQSGDGYALLLSGPIGNLPEPQPLRRREP